MSLLLDECFSSFSSSSSYFGTELYKMCVNWLKEGRASGNGKQYRLKEVCWRASHV
jgi:hypothetical protein